MTVPNKTMNSVHRYPFTAIQSLADMATTGNQNSIHQHSQYHELERKMNDDHRDHPLQSATIKATRYVRT